MGLFSCAAGPDAPVSKKVLLVQLAKERESLEDELKNAKLRINALGKELQDAAEANRAAAQLKREHEVQLLEEIMGMVLAAEKNGELSRRHTEISAFAYEPEEEAEQATAAELASAPFDDVRFSRESREPMAQEGDEAGISLQEADELHAEDPQEESCPAAGAAPQVAVPEDEQLSAAVRMLRNRLTLLLKKLRAEETRSEQLAATNSDLQSKLSIKTEALAQKEASEERAKSQVLLQEMRCSALEQQNEGLTGVGRELEKQVSRLQSELAELQAAKQAAADKQQAELLASQLRGSSLSDELRELREQLGLLRLSADERDARLSESEAARATAEAKAAALAKSVEERELKLQKQSSMRAAEKQRRGEAEREAEGAKLLLAQALEREAAMKASAEAKVAGLEASLSQSRSEVAELEQALEIARRRLEDLDGEVLPSLNEELRKVARRASAAEQELVEARSAAKQAALLASELAATQAQLGGCRTELLDAQSVASAARATAEAEARAAADMTQQYLTAKKDLIATAKQLASLAEEQSNTQGQLTKLSKDLNTTQQELAKAQAQLQEMAHEKTLWNHRLRELEQEWPPLVSELTETRAAYEEARRDIEGKRALLTAISRMSLKGGRQGQDETSLLAYYQAALNEDCLRLKLCDVPLGLCGSLLAAVADSRQLRHLALDMETSKEAVWEKAGLRTACLAAALGMNSTLQSLELSGWTWNELGNGSVMPFLTLGSLGSGCELTCVKVNTRLFDVDCAASLAELLRSGTVQLKKPGGQGVLRIYSDSDALDEWYGHMVQDAEEVQPAQKLGWRAEFPFHAVLLQQPLLQAGSSSCSTPPSKLTGAAGEMLTPREAPSSARSQRSGGDPAGWRYPAAVFPPTPVQTEAPALPPAPVDSDLSSMGLESHHMVTVMVVLLTCPHLQGLKLNGNQIGNGGAELLALGLRGNSSLQVLGLGHNSILAAGAKKLAKALEAHTSLAM